MEQNIKDILCRVIQLEDPYFKNELELRQARLYSKVFYEEMCEKSGLRNFTKTFRTEERKPI